MTAALLVILALAAIAAYLYWEEARFTRHVDQALALTADNLADLTDDCDDCPIVSVSVAEDRPDGEVTLTIDDLAAHIEWRKAMRLALMLNSAAAIAGTDAGHTPADLDAEHQRAHEELRDALRKARGWQA